MKRTFALTGFTMLGTLLVFCNIKSAKAVSVAVMASLAVLLFSVVFYAFKKSKALIAVSLCMFVALCSLQLSNINYENNKYLYCDKEINISGSLNALPYFENGRHYYPVETSFINGERCRLSIRLVSASPIDFEPGDEIKASVKTYLLGKDDESFVNYYRSKAMSFGGYIQNGENVEVRKNVNHSITGLLLELRSRMCISIMYVLPNDSGAVLCSIVLGEKSELSDRAQNAFRISGVSHLFAVSGLHLSVWSALIFGFMKKLRLSNKKAGIFSILFCIFFMLLTGLNPPVVRAGFMMIILYGSDLFSREADAYNSIGLAVTVMLLFNPYCALSISLWLSLLATLGILLLNEPVGSALEKANTFLTGKKPGKLSSAILSIISVSVSVTVFSLPVYIFKFNNFSSLILISNLLMVSIGTLCMELAGTASILMLINLGFLGKPLMMIAGFLSKILLKTAMTLSGFRYALIPVNSAASRICFAVIIISVAVLLILKIKSKRAVKACAFTLVLAFVITNATVYFTDFNRLNLCIDSTQNGTGIVMKYKGKSMVFCSRLDSFEEYELTQSITNLAVSSVDCLVLPDCKSFDGATLNKVIRSFDVRNLLVPTGCADSPACLECNTGFFDSSEINIIPDELTVYLNSDAAKIVFFNTEIVILFRNDIILNNSDADILVSPGELPEKNDLSGVRLCVFSGTSDETTDSRIVSTAELGTVKITVNKDQSFSYGRAADAFN